MFPLSLAQLSFLLALVLAASAVMASPDPSKKGGFGGLRPQPVFVQPVFHPVGFGGGIGKGFGGGFGGGFRRGVGGGFGKKGKGFKG